MLFYNNKGFGFVDSAITDIQQKQHEEPEKIEEPEKVEEVGEHEEPEKVEEPENKEVLKNAKKTKRYMKMIWIIAREANLKSYLDRNYRDIDDLARMK